MNSWIELEQRFRSLAGALRHIRLDRQWGASGEYWRLAGGSTNTATQEFVTLSAIAGKKLALMLTSDSATRQKYPEIAAESNDTIRWYRALVQMTGRFTPSFPAEQLGDDGAFEGHIFFGSLNDLADNAGNLCLRLHSETPTGTPTRRASQIWDAYGKEIVTGLIVTVVGGAILYVAGLI